MLSWPSSCSWSMYRCVYRSVFLCSELSQLKLLRVLQLRSWLCAFAVELASFEHLKLIVLDGSHFGNSGNSQGFGYEHLSPVGHGFSRVSFMVLTSAPSASTRALAMSLLSYPIFSIGELGWSRPAPLPCKNCFALDHKRLRYTWMSVHKGRYPKGELHILTNSWPNIWPYLAK